MLGARPTRPKYTSFLWMLTFDFILSLYIVGTMFNKTTPVGQRLKLIRDHQIQKHRQNAPQRRERKPRVVIATDHPVIKTLWSHLVFTRVIPRKIGRNTVLSRTPTVVNGLFNQVFALFTAVDLTRTLGRQQLVVANFYIQFNVRQLNVPVSRVIQLSSLLVPASDWKHTQEPITPGLPVRSFPEIPEHAGNSI